MSERTKFTVTVYVGSIDHSYRRLKNALARIDEVVYEILVPSPSLSDTYAAINIVLTNNIVRIEEYVVLMVTTSSPHLKNVTGRMHA